MKKWIFTICTLSLILNCFGQDIRNKVVHMQRYSCFTTINTEYQSFQKNINEFNQFRLHDNPHQVMPVCQLGILQRFHQNPIHTDDHSLEILNTISETPNSPPVSDITVDVVSIISCI